MTDHRPTEPVTEPADPWPQSPYPQVVPATGGTARRGSPRWWLWTVMATAVLAVAAFLAALSWPIAGRHTTGRMFQPMDQVLWIDVAEPSDNTFSQVVGDRGFVAWQQGDDLQLAAVDLADPGALWETRVAGAQGQYWGGLLAGPEAVVVYGYPVTPEDETEQPEPLPMVVLDAATGGERYRWQREIYPDDEVWLADQTLVLVDRAEETLRGLRYDAGATSWTVRFPGPAGAVAAVLPVFGSDLLAGPSTWSGGPAAPRVERLVMVGEERSARLIDAATGQVVGTVGTNVAYPDDALIAAGGRLLIGAGHDGYQIYARDLSDLAAQPVLLYTTPDPQRGLVAPPLPCGEQLLCLLDDASSDGSAIQLQVVDIAPDRASDPLRWSRDVPGADWLVPAGEWLLVSGYGAGLVGFDRDGHQVLRQPDGTAARLDAAHLLVFASVPTSGPEDLSVAGWAVGGDRVELGQASDVHGERCSWNDAYLLCPGEQGAGIWRFATGAG